tara:strand:- start:11336 stop:11710 length:375 start_codon:yes stop_codon:yes gene_type:complete
MTKEFNLALKEREFFRAYIEMLKPFLKKIRDREADVFAELIYWNYKKRDIKNKNDRFKLIMDADCRKQIEEKIGISTAIFRNALSGLRQRGLLLDDNTINDVYLVTPEKKVTLSFIFNLSKDIE